MSSILESKRDQYILALASLFLMAGVTGTRPLVPLLADQYGASVGHIGVIVSTFSFLPLLLVIQMGVWIDHHGTKKPLVVSSLLCSASLMLLFLMPSLAGLYISQILAGFAQTLFVLSAQTFVGSTSQPSQRVKNVATFSLGVGAGSFIGPAMGGFSSDLIGYTSSFLLLGAFSLIAALIAVFIRESQQGIQTVGQQEVFNKEATFLLMKNRDLRKVFLISSLILLAKDMYVAYFPLLANNSGLSGSMIGIIVSMHTIAGVLIRWYLPQLTERFGKSEVIVVSILSGGIIYLMIPFTDQVVLWGILSFLLGIGLGIGQPLSISTTITYSPENRIAEVLGLRLSFNRLTQVFAPLMLGGLTGIIGINAVFWLIGGILIYGSKKTYIKMESKPQI